MMLILAVVIALPILQRALAGDQRAGRALLARLTPVIQARVRALLRRRRSSLDPDDVVQDVWSGLFREDGRLLRKYDPTSGFSLEGYVGGVATRIASDTIRHSRAHRRDVAREVQGVETERVASGEDAAEAHADRDLLQRLFAHLEATLSTRGRLVLRCLFADGLGVRETAQALNVTEQVVYNWRFKIKQEAQAFMAAQGVAA